MLFAERLNHSQRAGPESAREPRAAGDVPEQRWGPKPASKSCVLPQICTGNAGRHFLALI